MASLTSSLFAPKFKLASLDTMYDHVSKTWVVEGNLNDKKNEIIRTIRPPNGLEKGES
jgi:hypothetical protein